MILNLSKEELIILGSWCDFGFDEAVEEGNVGRAKLFHKIGTKANLLWAERKKEVLDSLAFGSK